MKANRRWLDSVMVFTMTGILTGSLVGACFNGSPAPEIGALFFAIIGAVTGHLTWNLDA